METIDNIETLPISNKKNTYTTKPYKKYERKTCEHDKRRARCKECKGVSICKHDILRFNCKVCKGSSICIHNNYRSYCKECKGSSICEHNRIRSRCKECNGNLICKHNRERYACRDCKGSSICEHDRRRSICKECNGGSICEHNKIRSRCKECNGSSICDHNKQRSNCKECKGVSICSHNRRCHRCKECKGSSICDHNKQRANCKECKGVLICEHGKHKTVCKSCGGSALCKSSWCEKAKIKKYNGYCMTCCLYLCPDIKISRNYKTKEKDTTDRIIEAFPNFSWVADKKIIDGCSRRRPDLLLDLGSHILILEIDENKHTAYDCSCENKRLMEISQDLGHRPIVFIRFNPDGYIDKDGKKITSCWSLNKLGVITISKKKQEEWLERIQNLKNQIQYWIDNQSEKTIEIIELYY